MASAMCKAVAAGREAYRAGRIPRRAYASASSPIDGLFFDTEARAHPSSRRRPVRSFVAARAASPRPSAGRSKPYPLATRCRVVRASSTLPPCSGARPSAIWGSAAGPERPWWPWPRATPRTTTSGSRCTGQASASLARHRSRRAGQRPRARGRRCGGPCRARPGPGPLRRLPLLSRPLAQVAPSQTPLDPALVCHASAGELRPHGRVFVATDWEDYALHILSVMSGEAGFVNLAGTAAFAPRPCWRPLTRYEQRARQRGHVVRDMVFSPA